MVVLNNSMCPKKIWQLGDLRASDFLAGLSEVPQLPHVQVVRDERAATLSVELDSLVLRPWSNLVRLRAEHLVIYLFIHYSFAAEGVCTLCA